MKANGFRHHQLRQSTKISEKPAAPLSAGSTLVLANVDSLDKGGRAVRIGGCLRKCWIHLPKLVDFGKIVFLKQSEPVSRCPDRNSLLEFEGKTKLLSSACYATWLKCGSFGEWRSVCSSGSRIQFRVSAHRPERAVGGLPMFEPGVRKHCKCSNMVER